MIMKAVISTVFLSCLISFSAWGNEKAEELLSSVKSDDIDRFESLLTSGVDPSLYPEGSHFKKTGLCESTKKGKEAFLHAILKSDYSVDYRASYGSQYGSALLCSIAYKNKDSYRSLLEAGIDPNQEQIIETARGTWTITPLQVAAATRRFEFVVDLLSRIEPNDKQISVIVRALEKNGGVAGGPSQPYRKQLISWLRDNGVVVNPASPYVIK